MTDQSADEEPVQSSNTSVSDTRFQTVRRKIAYAKPPQADQAHSDNVVNPVEQYIQQQHELKMAREKAQRQLAGRPCVHLKVI